MSSNSLTYPGFPEKVPTDHYLSKWADNGDFYPAQLNTGSKERHCGPTTTRITTSSASVWTGCIKTPAVWNLVADLVS